ncbi:MAG: M23 family metallopeptidase [Polyangiaceae bacterium]
MKVDASGNSQRDDRHHVESYLAFGEPVLSPEDGVVVTARDGCRDHQRPGTGWIDWRARDIRGNFVVIRHEGGLFSFVGHLRCHSVRVRVGDHVRRGDVLGECGNSGHSTEPHIHFQVQDRESFYLGLGCPAALSGRVVGRSEGPPCGGAVYLSQGEDVEPFTGSVGAASNPVPVRVTVRDLGTSVLLFALNLLGVAFILYTEGALLFSGLRWLMNALE